MKLFLIIWYLSNEAKSALENPTTLSNKVALHNEAVPLYEAVLKGPNHLNKIFNERKLVLGTPDVKVKVKLKFKVKVKLPKSFGTVEYC